MDEPIAWVRIIESEFGLIVAACDKELLGKSLRRGDVEIMVSKEFYGEKAVCERELITLMSEADSLNLIGNRVVSLAERLGLLSPDAKIFFTDESGNAVPHAQMYRFML